MGIVVPRDTKERILRETLLAFSSLRFEDISLATIAKRVGISKTAIFRHFKNKQELFDTLDARVLEQVVVLRDQLLAIDRAVLSEAGYRSKVFETLAFFFSGKPELLPYLLQKTFNPQTSVVTTMLLEVFESRKAVHSIHDGFDMSTMCFFLTQMVCDYPGDSVTIHRYADAVSQLIENGFSCFEELADRRMEELDELTTVSAEETTQDRFFIALDEVMKQYGPFGISVERIADELGLANSTIYATYVSKEMMIRQTVIKEFLHFGKVLSKRLVYARSLSEAIYIILATASSYCSQSIPLSEGIICWICLNGKLDCNSDDFERFDFQPRQNPELGAFYEQFQKICDDKSVDVNLISRWIMFLPFSYFLMQRLCPEARLAAYADKLLYRLIRGGVEGTRDTPSCAEEMIE
jgi:AcrR family transcriptional regulator